MAVTLFIIGNFLSITDHLMTDLILRTLLPAAVKCFGRTRGKDISCCFQQTQEISDNFRCLTHFILARYTCVCVCCMLATEVCTAKYTSKTFCRRSTSMIPSQQGAKFNTWVKSSQRSLYTQYVTYNGHYLLKIWITFCWVHNHVVHICISLHFFIKTNIYFKKS